MSKQDVTKKYRLMKHKAEMDYRTKKSELDKQYKNKCKELLDEKNSQILFYSNKYKEFLILNGYSTNRKKTISKAIKEQSWNHWIGHLIGETLCPICEHRKISPLNFDAGHIKPECKGGEIKCQNIMPICHQCNLCMGSKSMYEYLHQINKITITLKGQIHSIEKLRPLTM